MSHKSSLMLTENMAAVSIISLISLEETSLVRMKPVAMIFKRYLTENEEQSGRMRHGNAAASVKRGPRVGLNSERSDLLVEISSPSQNIVTSSGKLDRESDTSSINLVWAT